MYSIIRAQSCAAAAVIIVITCAAALTPRASFRPLVASSFARAVARGSNARIAGQAQYRPASSVSSVDYNPVLASVGQIGNPGIKARFNPRAFQYASVIIGEILTQEIKRARIPPISQCVPEVNGCVKIYNLYVSRFRCPQRVIIYPAPPNRVILAVQNLDIGITGNLGGQIVILLPIALTGIINVNAYQVSISVDLSIDRGANGAPIVRVNNCVANVGFVDAYIDNGGLIGQIINSQFRGKISQQIRPLLQTQLCAQAPQLVNQQLNNRLASLPTSIALSQILSMIGGAINVGSSSSAVQPQQQQQQQQQQIVAPYSRPISSQPQQQIVNYHQSGAVYPSSAYAASPQQPYRGRIVVHRVRAAAAARELQPNSVTASPGVAQRFVHHHHASSIRNKRLAPVDNQTRLALVQHLQRHRILADVNFVDDGGQAASQLFNINDITKYLDLTRLNDLYVSLMLINTYATQNDFTIDISGEISPFGQGGTPFGAAPLYFTSSVGDKMAEALISDYTLNSLFYHIHRKGVINFRLGPETPTLGQFLKTTCSDDEDSSVDLEDHGVETEEANNTGGGERARRTRTRQHHRIVKRQEQSTTPSGADEEGIAGLGGLGICAGDILPAIREKYPNSNLSLQFYTSRAPSIVFSAQSGGIATIELDALVDIYIERQPQPTKAGTLGIGAVVDIAIRSTAPEMVAGSATIQRLQLTDRSGTLGLPQDALDNLSNLAKELLQKLANDALGRGFPVSIPGNLPINFINPSFEIQEHAIYIASDFTISPTVLSSLSSGGVGGGAPC